MDTDGYMLMYPSVITGVGYVHLFHFTLSIQANLDNSESQIDGLSAYKYGTLQTLCMDWT